LEKNKANMKNEDLEKFKKFKQKKHTIDKALKRKMDKPNT
jgi:hypothetical protein